MYIVCAIRLIGDDSTQLVRNNLLTLQQTPSETLHTDLLHFTRSLAY